MKTILTMRAKMIWLAGLFFLTGVRTVIAEAAGLVDVLLSLIIAILTICVCAEDAARRGRPLLQVYQWIMFFTWPFSVFVYCLIAHRLKGLGLVLLWSLLFALCAVAGCLAVIGIAALSG